MDELMQKMKFILLHIYDKSSLKRLNEIDETKNQIKSLDLKQKKYKKRLSRMRRAG